MDITLAGSVVAYAPNDDQVGGLTLEFAAFDGEVGTGVLPIPDNAGVLTVAGGRACRVDEGATRLTDGFVIDHDRERGPSPVGREYGFGVMDANALLDGFRVKRNRASETDVARVLAFAALDGPSWDTSMVLVSDTVTMPKKKYDSDGGWTSELIPDLVEFTGKTLFLHDFADGSGRCLHYHVLTAGHTSGLAISDVIAGVDSVTTWAPQNPVRQRTSIDLRNNVRGRDQKNRRYTASDSTSIAAHNADGLKHQALVDFEASSAADLRKKTNAMLASHKNELDTYTCEIGPLDETALALIRAGDYISTTSSVFGLTASSQRIAHMTLRPDIPGWWTASLELGRPIRRRARIKARRPPDIPPPFVPECETTDTFDRDDGLPGTSDAGIDWTVLNGTVVIEDDRLKVVPSGGAEGDAELIFPAVGSPMTVTFDFEAATSGNTNSFFLAGGVAIDFAVSPSAGFAIYHVASGGAPQTHLPFTVVPGTRYDVHVLYTTGDAFTPDNMKVNIWEKGTTEPGGWMVDHDDDTPGGGFLDTRFSATALNGNGALYVDNLDIGGVCGTLMEPLQGQTVREIIGTGDNATTVFTTSWPYRENTVELTASGLPEHDFAETDPDAGTVTFGTAPFTGEIIRAEYQAQ